VKHFSNYNEYIGIALLQPYKQHVVLQKIYF